MAEIDVHIDLKIYRTVVRYPLDLIHSQGLYDVVKSRVQTWGQRSQKDIWTLKYKNRGGELSPVTHDFPRDTDGGWREFFSAVFYVDF